MIYREALFVLPLMNHFMQQRQHGFVPAVPANVAAADDYLHLPSLPAPEVMPEPALHAARNANWHGVQLTAESRGVERLVTLRQLARKSFIRGMGSLDGPLSFRLLAGHDVRARTLRRVERKRQLA